MRVYKRCPVCEIVLRTDKEVCGGYVRPADRKTPGETCTGVLVVDEGCQAVLCHGPGRQSTARCERGSIPHVIHYALGEQFHGEQAFVDDWGRVPEVPDEVEAEEERMYEATPPLDRALARLLDLAAQEAVRVGWDAPTLLRRAADELEEA